MGRQSVAQCGGLGLPGVIEGESAAMEIKTDWETLTDCETEIETG